MNIQDMLSKMSPEKLQQGLKKASSMLSAEQLKQMENAIKNMDSDNLNQKFSSMNAEDIQNELQKNPGLMQQLSGNPELMKQISDIFKKK